MTTDRMKALFVDSGQAKNRCLFDCGFDEDTLDHYMLSDKYKVSFMNPDLPVQDRAKNGFLN